MKRYLLKKIPTRILNWYFRLRGYCLDMKPEVLRGMHILMTINKDNDLWIDRLTKPEGHEPTICKWLQKNLGEHEVIYDVGSHFGFFPALISHLRSKSEIHCFQPYIYAYNFLRINQFKYRKTNKWIVNEKFVSDHHSGDQITLDKYALEKKWPSLIKIDIDGPEVFALKGCQQILEARKTRFLVEVHPILMRENFGHSWDSLLECIPSGYTFRYLPNLRTGDKWEDHFDTVSEDDNPYIYFCPEEIKTDTF